MRAFLDENPRMRTDPRLALDAPWLKAQILNAPPLDPQSAEANGKEVMDAFKAGARIVAGTDEPEAMYLHNEIAAYVRFGMTPYDALRAASAVPAEFLGLDAGVIAPGKLADIVLVEGNPLEKISDTTRVRQVIANGRRFTIEDLVTGRAKNAPR
jgi:imidazolonepropionase-like amidohydrolase